MLVVVFFATEGNMAVLIGWYACLLVQNLVMWLQLLSAHVHVRRLDLSYLTIFPKSQDPDRLFLQRVDEETCDQFVTTDFHEIKRYLYQPESCLRRLFHPGGVGPAENVLKIKCLHPLYGSFSFLVKDTREVRFAIYSKFYGSSSPSLEDDVFILLTETTDYEFGREKAGDFSQDDNRPVQRDPMLFFHVLSFPVFRHLCDRRTINLAYQRCCCCRPFKMACTVGGVEQEHMIRLPKPVEDAASAQSV